MVEADSELMRQFREVIAHWPYEVKLAFLQGRISLEQAMQQARLMGFVETVQIPAVQGLKRQ